jgi:putative restriction endonuclease
MVLSTALRPKDHIDVLRPLLPTKYSPLRLNGDGLQSIYLTELPQALAETLRGLIGQRYWDAYAALTQSETVGDLAGTEDPVDDRTIVGPTFRAQVVKARRGQGVFRSNVLLR